MGTSDTAFDQARHYAYDYDQLGQLTSASNYQGTDFLNQSGYGWGSYPYKCVFAMIAKFFTILIFLFMIISCTPGGEGFSNKFSATPEGGRILIPLPYRHAGWFLSMRGPNSTDRETIVSIVVTNQSSELLYVRSQLGKNRLGDSEQVTVFTGSLQEVQEEMSTFVSSDHGGLAFIVSITADRKLLLITSYELVAYTSDGP